MKTHTDSLSQPVVSRIPPDLSDRVRIARFLCIFLMMFVHVEPGISANVYDRDAGLFDLIYFIFARLFGLSSVSLLSVVSGYFVVASLGKAVMCGGPPGGRRGPRMRADACRPDSGPGNARPHSAGLFFGPGVFRLGTLERVRCKC